MKWKSSDPDDKAYVQQAIQGDEAQCEEHRQMLAQEVRPSGRPGPAHVLPSALAGGPATSQRYG